MTRSASNNIIKTISDFLRRRPEINLLLILIFSVFIIVMHDHMVHISIYLMNSLSLPLYNKVVAILGGFTVFAFGTYLIHKLWQDENQRKWKAIILLVSILLLLIHFFIMLEMNIEIIHSLQYAILALLIFPLFQRYSAAVIFSIPIMLFDEWYQYVILYPGYTRYFEMNDIVLDILGAGFAMVSLWVLDVRPGNANKSLVKRPELWLLGALVIAYLAFIATCIFALYPNTACPHTIFILNQLDQPELFWQVHHFTGARYHVLRPLEGLVLILGLCAFYVFVDRVACIKT